MLLRLDADKLEPKSIDQRSCSMKTDVNTLGTDGAMESVLCIRVTSSRNRLRSLLWFVFDVCYVRMSIKVQNYILNPHMSFLSEQRALRSCDTRG